MRAFLWLFPALLHLNTVFRGVPIETLGARCLADFGHRLCQMIWQLAVLHSHSCCKVTDETVRPPFLGGLIPSTLSCWHCRPSSDISSLSIVNLLSLTSEKIQRWYTIYVLELCPRTEFYTQWLPSVCFIAEIYPWWAWSFLLLWLMTI